jgi:hypothetical protein
MPCPSGCPSSGCPKECEMRLKVLMNQSETFGPIGFEIAPGAFQSAEQLPMPRSNTEVLPMPHSDVFSFWVETLR